MIKLTVKSIYDAESHNENVQNDHKDMNIIEIISIEKNIHEKVSFEPNLV